MRLSSKKIIWPGLFLIGLLAFMPIKGVQACDNGACAECGDGVVCVLTEGQCFNPTLGTQFEQCDVGEGNEDDCPEGKQCNPETCQCEDVPFCGDNEVNPELDEECDGTDDSVCPGACNSPESGLACKCGVCGNGVEGPGEGCDNGSRCGDEGDDCTSCFSECIFDPQGPCFGGNRESEACLTCLNDCCEGDVVCGPQNDDGCNEDCEDEFCGDGIKQKNEGCDASAPDGEVCDEGFQCALPGQPNECECELCPKCGDGIEDTELGEECDDGSHCKDGTLCSHTDGSPDDVCNDGSDCVPRSGDGCEANCTDSFCGNGVVDEQSCLEGQNKGEGCEEECDAASGNSNSGLCTEDCQLAFCGDGLELEPTEVCDDGNTIDGDGCSSDCQECPNEPVCGDAMITTASEDCDPDIESENHGCDSDEVCNPETCQCDPVSDCGNGIKEDGEDCDCPGQKGDEDNITCAISQGDPMNEDSLGCVAAKNLEDEPLLRACQFAEAVCGNEIAAGAEECDAGGTCSVSGADCTVCDPDFQTLEGPNCATQNDANCGEPSDGDSCVPKETEACDEVCTEKDNECPPDDSGNDKHGACDPEDEVSNGGHKVTICHIPPGNPDNSHTICIDEHALETHQTHHGDSVGACENECSAEPGLTVGEFGEVQGGGCSLIGYR